MHLRVRAALLATSVVFTETPVSLPQSLGATEAEARSMQCDILEENSQSQGQGSLLPSLKGKHWGGLLILPHRGPGRMEPQLPMVLSR